jgi:hypothetical protein
MLHPAPPVLIRERLLSEAVRRHELSARALPEIQDLLRQGLSFEQVLVGTGLITARTFLSWMQTACGLPILSPTGGDHTLPPGLELELVLAWQVIPQKVSAKKWVVGLTNPWDQDIRAAVEAVAVEHGWSLEFAYVLPSVADEWLHAAGEARRSADALAHYARNLVERVQREKRHTLIQAGHTSHPREAVSHVPAAWFPALHLRLTRRAGTSELTVKRHRHHHHAKLELEARRTTTAPQSEAEHPVRDWSETFQAFFDQGKLVFLYDQPGGLLERWTDVHVPRETEEWRAGKRWFAQPTSENQEELFQLTLAGYPGTVCFQSKQELSAWEQAAEAAYVPYAACISRVTDEGTAWSLYTL